MMELHERLVKAREYAGFENATDAAEALGVKYPTYAGHENGSSGFRASSGELYSRRYGVRFEWLMSGKGPMIQGSAAEVPLVGYVGAGAEAHFYATGQGALDMVPAPEGATKDTVAVQIRGESLGALFQHWLVYYDEVRSPVTHDMIGRLCVVGLADDRILVKQINRSKTAGLYHLISNTEPPIFDVEVIWAAKVKQMVPRG